MKNILLVILTIFTGLQVFAQENGITIIQACGDPSYDYSKKANLFKGEDYIHKLVHKKAQPKEGFDVFFKNLNTNIKDDLEDKIKRPLTLKDIVIKIRFVVEKDGSLTNMTTIEDKFDLANEVFKIIKEKSKWKPAELENKIVRMYFTLPIRIPVN
ncbi:hypothetical protein SAMN02927937_02834 [Paenimyroides aquimaris]|uniref:TonB C-terminal domain-containing protein n=1 Tax=Paenimyroides marinum TaxID=1159016 RepID=A0A1H6MM11_9FLAO|nr:hypothetical protein [Paenimyroides aquimaris]SEI02818.1 hypothetical protein SAMN02927937_02834 [Paenimyroides aquimaris]